MAQVTQKKLLDIDSNVTLEEKYKVKTKNAPCATKQLSVNSERVKGELVAKHKKATVTTYIPTRTVATKNGGFPVTVIIGALICTAMIMFMVFNYALQYELTVNISKTQKNISKLETQLSELNTQIDTALDSKDIQSYTSEVLGFVPKAELSARIISTDRTDRITVTKAQKDEKGLQLMLSSLYDTIKNIFE